MLTPRVLAQCELIALEARARLGLAAVDRLDPGALADYLRVEVQSIDAFRGSHPDEVRHLTQVRPMEFAAAMVPCGDRRRILYNPAHPVEERFYTLAHELAHLLLDHEATPLFDEFLKRRLNPVEEAEADYLAGALLVPRIGVAHVMRQYDNDLTQAARHYGVSRALLRARLEATRPAESVSRVGRALESELARWEANPPAGAGEEPAPQAPTTG